MSSNKMNGACIMNGTEKKSPFLIGVAGGTASGKVNQCYLILHQPKKYDNCRVQYAPKLWKSLDKLMWTTNKDK